MNTFSAQFDRTLLDASVMADGSFDLRDKAVTQNVCKSQNAELDSERIGALLENIHSAIESLNVQSNEVAREARLFAIRLASTIVKTVFGNSDDEKIQRIEHLLSEAMDATEPVLKVFVNGVDRNKLESVDAISKSGILLECDESIQAGECRVEFATHELVSDLEEQLASIEQHLLDAADEF